MAHWIAKKYDNGNQMYVSGFDDNGNPIHTKEKNNAEKFHDISIPMALCNEQNYCIEKEY